MIHCIFTLDYEIYGNGEGSLRDLVLEPTRILAEVFRKRDAKFVVFAEVNELQRIEECGVDTSIGEVKDQLRRLHDEGFEVALHLHPQWCKATHNGKWHLYYPEYNLCTLPRPRICEIVDESIGYIRRVLADPGYTPVSFRAGNWLFQPSQPATDVLLERGIRIDSSVFKGGIRHENGLDYRKSLRIDEPYWRFTNDVQEPDSAGLMTEVPIHTEHSPFWRMLSAKRAKLEGKAIAQKRSRQQLVCRVRDLMRFRHPEKFDFCRLSLDRQLALLRGVEQRHQNRPGGHIPVVAIGHTKEHVDSSDLDSLLHAITLAGHSITSLKGFVETAERE